MCSFTSIFLLFVFIFLFPACLCASLVCVRVFCMTERAEVHLWMLKLASIWCVGPLIPASYILDILSSPVYCRHFCTLSLYVSRGIMDLHCRWVFTAEVLNTEPTVAFIWENIFVHKCKRASVSDHLRATEDDRRHLQLSRRPEFYTPGGAHSSPA